MDAQERKQAKQANFVRIGFEDQADSVKVVPREKMTYEHITAIYDCDVEFVQEAGSGNVVFPGKWQTDCLPPPYTYWIRKKIPTILAPDAMEQYEYRGDSIIVVVNVPENVKRSALSQWIQFGLDDDFNRAKSDDSSLPELIAKLKELNQQIESLPSSGAVSDTHTGTGGWWGSGREER